MMPTRHVAITGIGMVSPLGPNAPIAWEQALLGKTGIRSLGSDQPAALRWAGVMDAPSLPEDIPDKLIGQAKFLNRSGVFSVLAAREAAQDAGWPGETNESQRSLYLATGDLTKVGFEFLFPATQEASDGHFDRWNATRLNQATLAKVNPFYLLESICNNPFSFITALLQSMGPGTTLASQSPSGSQSVELAFRSIATGRSQMAMVVGSGSWVSAVARMEMSELRLLSGGKRNETSYRPFDIRRDGFFPGEGAAALVLEPLDAATTRGANIHGVIRAIGASTQAGNGLAPPDDVGLPALRYALDSVGWTSHDLGFACGHGSGTRRGDRAELSAWQTVLEGANVPLVGLKPLTGHMGAASDVGELVLGLLALKHGRTPPTLHFERTESPFQNLRIRAEVQDVIRPSFVALSFGMGGQSSAILISRSFDSAQ